MNITNIHVLNIIEIEAQDFYTVEITEGLDVAETFTQTWGRQQLQDFISDDNIEVTYEEENEDLEDALKLLQVGYVEVDVNADGSGEHDVYMHKVSFCSGEVSLDIHGKHIKTYKREKSAINFAESLGLRVKIN